MSAPLELVARLRRAPEERDAALVLADWCEEHGFTDVAGRLRSPANQLAYLQAIWTLSSLFGLESTIFNRYTFVAGLPRCRLAPNAVTAIEVGIAVVFRLRRLVLSTDNAGVAVSAMRAGPHDLLFGLDEVPGVIFSAELGFDTFNQVVPPDHAVQVHVRNFQAVPLLLTGCLLGDAPGPQRDLVQLGFPAHEREVA